MRTILLLGVLALMGSAFANPQQQPGGSYRETCSNISVSGDTLKADCRSRDGRIFHQALKYHACKNENDIRNIDGALWCDCKEVPEGGSYEATCVDAGIRKGTLVALCLTADHKRVPATLDNYWDCKAGIDNANGALVCKGQRKR